MIEPIALLYLILTLLGPGSVLVALLGVRGDRLPVERWLPLAFLLGWTFHTILLLGSLRATGMVHPLLHASVSALLPLLFLPILWTRNQLNLTAESTVLRLLFGRGTPVLVLFLFAAIAYRLGILLQEAYQIPLFSWDGRYIWNLKARILFHEGTIFGSSWMDPVRVHFHRDYPLMLPTAWAGLYHWMGETSERMPRVFLVVMMLLFVLYFFEAVRSRAGAPLAAVGSFILLDFACRQDYQRVDGATLLTGVADLPLAFLAFAAFEIGLRGWASKRHCWMLVSAFLVSGCYLMKSEGLVVLLVWVVVTIRLYIAHEPEPRGVPPLRTLLGSILILIAVAAPWFLLKRELPNYYDERFTEMLSPTNIEAILARLIIVGEYFLEELVNWWRWGVFWPVYILLAAAGWIWGRRSTDLAIEWAVLPWIAIYLLAYMITPLHIGYHLETSLARLYSHFAPLALFSLLLKGQRLIRLANVAGTIRTAAG
jgi:hypothetical protein